MRPSKVGVLVVAVAACSSPSGSISLTTGGETDALTRSPAPTELLVEAVQRDATRTTLAQTALPGATGTDLDLGSPSSTTVASIQITAKDSNGTTLLFGASPYVELLALQGLTMPVFVQRNGELARMPGTAADGRSVPLLAVSGRGIYAGGGTGDDGAVDGGVPPVWGYDLVFLDQFASECAATRVPRTVALQNAALLLVNDAGATVLDLSTCTSTDLGALATTATPTWGDLAGGVAVTAEDGSVFVVGPSKPDAPSSAIAKIDSSGNVTTASVAVARQGAATAWATGRGLFVFGGGGGVEILATSATSATAVGDYADSGPGLVASPIDANTMLVVGPSPAQPETVDLGCSTGCIPKPWGQPLAATAGVTPTALFGFGTGVFVAVGDDAQGATHVYRLDTATTTEVPLKIARQGARATQTPTGAVVIVGGGTTTLESYVP